MLLPLMPLRHCAAYLRQFRGHFAATMLIAAIDAAAMRHASCRMLMPHTAAFILLFAAAAAAYAMRRFYYAYLRCRFDYAAITTHVAITLITPFAIISR